MRSACAVLLLVCALSVQPHVSAPPILAQPLDPARPFPGWAAFRGNFVIVDFWATWCGPCIPGIDRIASMEREFAGKNVRFLTVANDSPERVRKFLRDRVITLQTFIEDGHDAHTSKAYGVRAIPASAIIDPEGRLLAVTPGENVTSEVMHKLLAGKTVMFPRFERDNNITWDQDEITWQDGVLPMFQVIIKPMKVTGGGYAYKPGSNHISGDGASVQGMIQAAWRTDANHLDIRVNFPPETYRFAATVPKGREPELFPTFQDALQRSFGIKAYWEQQERDVYILRANGDKVLSPSKSESGFQFMRGKIMLRNQSIAKLAETLPNWLRRPVVDETGYSGLYDFDLEYRDDSPATLTDGLREKYGIVINPGRRVIRVLVVETKT